VEVGREKEGKGKEKEKGKEKKRYSILRFRCFITDPTIIPIL